MIDLTKQDKKIYSQFNQDGVLECIFNTIGTTNKYFVEFGSYGTDDAMGNTPFLRHHFGFDGLLMDGTQHRDNAKYQVYQEFIQAETINELFIKYNVPSNFDFLSIDIDGEDYYVMKAIDLEKFCPRVVSIETNPHIIPPHKMIQKHDPNWIWGGGMLYGCSITAISELMNNLNYSLVAYCGVDAIFIKNEYLSKNDFQHVNNIEYLYKHGVICGIDEQMKSFKEIQNCGFFILTDEI